MIKPSLINNKDSSSIANLSHLNNNRNAKHYKPDTSLIPFLSQNLRNNYSSYFPAENLNWIWKRDKKKPQKTRRKDPEIANLIAMSYGKSNLTTLRYWINHWARLWSLLQYFYMLRMVMGLNSTLLIRGLDR